MIRSCMVFFLLWLLFLTKGTIFLDPDFGFHLRTGQLILERGVPRIDWLSYTMSTFPIVDHEWFFDVLLALLYPLIGTFGLSGVAATMIVSVLILSVKSAGIRIRSVQYPSVAIPLLLASAVLLSFAGVRPQIITWFFLGILYWFVSHPDVWRRWRVFVPFLFLFWANTHGGFAVGLAVLFLKILTECAPHKRNFEKGTILILLLSIFTTFINPYGFRIYEEVWRVFSDPIHRWAIAEWHPAVFFIDFGIILFVAFSLTFVFRYRQRFWHELLVLYSVFLLAAIASLRNVPLWIVVALPMTITAVLSFSRDIAVSNDAKSRWIRIRPVMSAAFIVFVMFDMFLSLNGALGWHEQSGYPADAVEYLRNHPSEGQLFASFDWGGFLDWRLPEKKVFVDGRMTEWRNHNASKESKSAFREYLTIISGETPMVETAARYGIDTVLWPIADGASLYSFWEKLEERLFPSRKQKLPHLVDQLLSDGWIIEWQDDLAMIIRNGKR